METKTITFPTRLLDEATRLIDSTPEDLIKLIREMALNYAEDCKETELSRMRRDITKLNKLAMLFMDANEHEGNIYFPASRIDDVTGDIGSDAGGLAEHIRFIALNYAEDCKETELSRMRLSIVTLNRIADLFNEIDICEYRKNREAI